MNRYKMIEQFLGQVIDTPETDRTAQGLRDALAAAGWGRENIEPIQDIYSDYCRTHNIKLDDPILAEYYSVTAEGKANEKEAEGRKRINEHIEIFRAGGNATDLHENLIKELQQIKSDRNRFTAWKNYFNDCVNYDPSKDFIPSMLAGLRFPNGSISYIGARPRGGKSTILVNIAREALAKGRSVFLVNMEMSNKAIITNFVLSFMYASASDKQRKELKTINNPMGDYYSLFKREDDTRETFDLLRHNALKTIEPLLDNKLFIYDGSGEKLETITRDIESRVNTGDVVLIDYIQRMPPPQNSSDQRYIQIKLTSEKLLNIALKKKIVIISGAQFKRPPDKTKKYEATLEDFREAGDIEQDAHNALGIEIINKESRYIHVLKEREGGSHFDRAELDCNFNYLYIAGTGKAYYNGKTLDQDDEWPDPDGEPEPF